MRSHFCPHRQVCESGVCPMCAQERMALLTQVEETIDGVDVPSGSSAS